MSFKYSVIGDNTRENREHLEKIGYVRGFFNIPNRGYIKTINPGIYNLTNIIQPLTEYINCIGNPALFQAVTAMRDDSDYMQWYYSSDHEKKNWYLSDRHVVKNKDCMINNVRVWHKATLSELQAHFQRV